VLNLLGFYLAWRARVSLDIVAAVFFVWLTVFVMFVVSVFWSFMADLFSTDQAKRLYGFIAAGGTLGALIGAKLTAELAQRFGASNLMLLSAALLAFTLLCIGRLLAWQSAQVGAVGVVGAVASAAAQSEAPVSGGVLAGIRDVMASPYLFGICLYVFCYTMLSTVLYFHQTDLLKREYPSIDARAALLGNLAFVVNVITLLVQAFAFKPLLNKFGVTTLLAAIPLLSVVGFAALAWAPTLAVLLVFGVLRSASEYALAKPVRETLFNSLSREQKYKAKNVIDTAVYRGGDWASAALMQALRGVVAFPLVAAIAVPLSAAWAGVGWWLGRQNERRQSAHTAARLKPAAQPS
jgi:ATP:ADP antiporter, AAA family